MAHKMNYSSNTDASDVRYTARRSSWVTRIFALRGLFVVSMMVAVVVCATVAFVMIRNLQEEIGVQTYERYVWI
eukprot:scaffold5479_cov199-Amphora_coffeaeformis.AAC.49